MDEQLGIWEGEGYVKLYDSHVRVDEAINLIISAIDLDVNLSDCRSYAEAREEVITKAFDKVIP